MWAVEHRSRPDHMAAAMVEKGADGELEMKGMTAPPNIWTGLTRCSVAP